MNQFPFEKEKKIVPLNCNAKHNAKAHWNAFSQLHFIKLTEKKNVLNYSTQICTNECIAAFTVKPRLINQTQAQFSFMKLL